ncbi:MAG: endonuclease V [Thermoplasmata archaeon]
MVDFLRELRWLLEQVPRGQVTSFKALADALGDGKAAKAVYETLKESKLPGWHRVVRSDGGIPFPEAAGTLAQEGIRLSDSRVVGFQGMKFTDFRSQRPLELLRREQISLASRVVLEDMLEEPEEVGGFDLSYQGNRAYAAAVVMDREGVEVLDEVRLTTIVSFPYISTYLSYREFEPISLCYGRLRWRPSVLLVDGNGILHPAGFGIACLVGVRLGRPTIGVAKSLLLGRVDSGVKQGENSQIHHRGRLLGYAYRPGRGKPIFISPGHMISPSTALELVKGLCKERVPEPLRLAHLACGQMRRAAVG